MPEAEEKYIAAEAEAAKAKAEAERIIAELKKQEKAEYIARIEAEYIARIEAKREKFILVIEIKVEELAAEAKEAKEEYKAVKADKEAAEEAKAKAKAEEAEAKAIEYIGSVEAAEAELKYIALEEAKAEAEYIAKEEAKAEANYIAAKAKQKAKEKHLYNLYVIKPIPKNWYKEYKAHISEEKLITIKSKWLKKAYFSGAWSHETIAGDSEEE